MVPSPPRPAGARIDGVYELGHVLHVLDPASHGFAPAEQNLIDGIKRLRAPLKVAADYSPEFGCLFGAIDRGIKEFAPILGVRKAGLFTSSSFVLGAPTYTYPESLPRVNASGSSASSRTRCWR